MFLVVGGVLELISVIGYAIALSQRVRPGHAAASIGGPASRFPLAGIAAIRLLSAAGAGGVAVTAWALRRAGMEAA